MSSLPNGFRVRIRDDVEVLEGGGLLVGGSPLTALRLTAPARRLVRDGEVVVADGSSRRLAERLLETNVADAVLTPADHAGAGEVTVVIPVRDRLGQLDAALAALGSTLRIVVVDDGSEHRGAVRDVVRRHGATYLRLPVNCGPAAARNAGLAVVTTPYVAFVDSDVRACAASILSLTGNFRDPRVALVGPLVQGRTGSERPRWFERYDVASSSLSLGARGCLVGPGAAVSWLPSACLLGRVSALDGGFDDTLRVGEDVDLVWRMLARGHRVRYDPAVVVQHDVRTTVGGWLGRKVFYGSGGAPLAARYGDATAVAVLSPESALAAAALLLRRRWALPVAVVFSVRGWHRLHGTLPGTLPLRLTARGVGWAVRQESALLLRHWWPLTVLALPVSRPVRRAVITALVVDAVVVLREHPEVGLLGALVARRLDDAAYGAGLWWGCLRAGSTVAVRVRRAGRRSG